MSSKVTRRRVLTVGGYAIGLPRRRIGSVCSSLLDSRAVLSLSIRCHCWERWDCHYMGIMSIQNKKTEGLRQQLLYVIF